MSINFAPEAKDYQEEVTISVNDVEARPARKKTALVIGAAIVGIFGDTQRESQLKFVIHILESQFFAIVWNMFFLYI